MSNIYGNLLDLVDYIYSPEGVKRNFGSIVGVTIERIYGLDRVSCDHFGVFPTISTAGSNENIHFIYKSRSMGSNWDWLKAKQCELTSFADTGRREFVKTCFTGMYVQSICDILRFDEVQNCYVISFYTYTEGQVIKRKTREKVTVMIELVEPTGSVIDESTIVTEEEVVKTYSNPAFEDFELEF